MNARLSLEKEIHLNAPASDVWNALTDPQQVKQYLCGAQVVSDWRVGSEIVYSGNFNGIDFRDEGEISVFEKDRRFQYTYWSANHGTENVKENHVVLTYSLEETASGTRLTVTQENYQSQEIVEAMLSVWDLILGNLKELVEAK